MSRPNHARPVGVNPTSQKAAEFMCPLTEYCDDPCRLNLDDLDVIDCFRPDPDAVVQPLHSRLSKSPVDAHQL